MSYTEGSEEEMGLKYTPKIMITTILTVVIKSTQDQFESEEFQELLNAIKSGEYRRELSKNPVTKDINVTYQTDYKQVKQ